MMIKYFIGLVVLIQVLSASSFPSLHEGKLLSTLLADKNFLNNEGDINIRKEFILSYSTSSIKKDGKKYYYRSAGWLHFKYYVPAGTSAMLVFATIPNASMRVDLKFRGDKNNIIDHIHPIVDPLVLNAADDPLYSNEQPTVEHIAINTFNQVAYDMDEGGWVYVSVVENSAEYRGDHGDATGATLNVDYTLRIVDKKKFENWIKHTTFLSPGGDPVDATNQLVEYDLTYQDGELKKIKRIYSLQTQGSYANENTDVSSANSEFSSSSSMQSQNSSEENTQIMEYEQENSSSLSGSNIPKAISEVNLTQEQKDVISKLLSKTIPINGYFIKIGQDKLDWVYITKEGKIYKLQGLDKNDNFKWLEIPNLTSIIEGNNIQFISNKDITANQTNQNSNNNNIDIESSTETHTCPDGYVMDPSTGYCKPYSGTSYTGGEASNAGGSVSTGALPIPH